MIQTPTAHEKLPASLLLFLILCFCFCSALELTFGPLEPTFADSWSLRAQELTFADSCTLRQLRILRAQELAFAGSYALWSPRRDFCDFGPEKVGATGSVT